MLLDDGKTDKIYEYLEQQNVPEPGSRDRIKTGNYLLDYILNSKLVIADDSGIPVTVDAIIPEKLPVDDKALCTVLLNLIDNALEASKFVEQSDIHISLKCINKYFITKITNRTAGNIMQCNPKLNTVKNNKNKHGYGLRIVRDIIDRGNGMFEIDSADNNFTVTVMLPLQDDLKVSACEYTDSIKTSAN